MAAESDLWHVDPFYTAAEEVQDSADRMESAYRTWKHVKALKGGSPETTSLAVVDARRRDLITALDTVKWQLEEFERAVELSQLTEQVYLEEKVASQYSQFVKAIHNQLVSFMTELGDATTMHSSQSPGRKFQGEDRDDFTEFLLGCTHNETTAKSGFCIPSSELHQADQDGQPSNKYVKRWGICGPPLNGHENGNISFVDGFDQPIFSPLCKNNEAKEGSPEEDNASSEFSMATSEGRDDSKGRHFSPHYPSSELSTSTSEGCFSPSPAHSIDMEMSGPYKLKKVEKSGILSRFCRFWKSKEPGNLPVSRSRLKKWKDGDADFEGCCDNGAARGFSMVHKSCILGSGQNFTNLCCSESPNPGSSNSTMLRVDDSNVKLLCGLQGTFEDKLSGIRQGFSADCSPKMFSVVFIVFIMAVIYLWFISTFLPENFANLPGKILN